MSVYDSSALTVMYTATSRSIQSPKSMTHPTCGAFQLLHLNLYEVPPGNTRQHEHKHDVYHLVIFEEANNQMLLNQKKLKTHRGLCVLTHPNDTHCFPPTQPDRIVYHALTFRFENMKHAPTPQQILTHYTGIRVPNSTPYFTLPETAMIRLPGVLAAIRSTLPPSKVPKAGQLHHSIIGLMLFIREQQHQIAARTKPPIETPIQTAQNYIDTHYAERLSMKTLARHVGLSPAHLGRIFHKQHKTSPAQYRDKLRMEAAENLLRHSDLLVKTIAYELGYPDASTFSKAFRRHTDISPQQCRQRERNGQTFYETL